MTRKKINPKAKRRTELCERFGYYHDDLFRGQTREMARALGITHSVISKVCRGLQGPGEDVLAALAAHPRVNSRWLLEGDGEPILPSTAGTLPITCRILPGPPTEYMGLLSGERYPVPPDWERDTRYWYRIGTHDQLRSMLKDDLLQIETARDHLDRLDLLHGRMCAVAVEQGETSMCVFADIFVRAGKIEARLHTQFGDQPRAYEQWLKDRSKKFPRSVTRRDQHGERMESKVKQSRSTDATRTNTDIIKLTSTNQIVGLILTLARPAISVLT